MRRRRLSFASAIALLLLLLAGRTDSGAADRSAALTFLASTFGLTTSDMDRVAGGEIVTRTLKSADSREVATLGVMRVAIPPEYYVERLTDIATLKTDEAILQIGTFADPAALPDVAELTLDERDLKLLRRCRLRDCGLRLPAETITRFQRDVNWQHPHAPRQAATVMHEFLVGYVQDYRAGTGAMASASASEPLNLRHEFASLIGSERGAWQAFPTLERHLLDYPGASSPAIRDLVYWSKERIASRGVVSVTHLAIASLNGESPAEYAIGSKQIYGAHYYDASLGLTVLTRDRSTSPHVTYLAYLNRSRIDLFDGVFGGLVRAVVRGKARSTVADQFARLQRMLERDFAQAQAR
ncbi:MAG: hypothetical protein ACT4QD_12415 [Acidobacteriota bacterium]